MQAHAAALLVGLLLVGVTALGGAGAVAGDAGAPHDPQVDGHDVNFTWTPSGTFGAENHYPDKTDASYESYSTTSKPGKITELDFIIITSEDLGMSECNPLDARSLGIDRNDDDPGPKTDESLTDHLERNSFSEDRILLKFFDEGDLAGDPVTIRDEDQIASATSACFANPSEPGWYRVNGLLNGSGVNGQGEQEYQTFDTMSHYFYICECDSEAEAQDRLGPRPSVESTADSGTGGAEERGATATATRTATRTRTATAAVTATTTDTATATATATATRTVTQTATADRTATATADPTTARETATATPGRTTTAAGAGPTTAEETATATRAPSQGGAGGAQRVGWVTPTVGEGPGFGALAALAGLLGVGLLRRRD
jgi:PGF-CTERM protein